MQSINLINPTPTAVGNWSLDVWCFAHPYIFGAVRTVDAANVVNWSPILNRQVDGATLQQKQIHFTHMVERYRLSYMGVTAYHDASAVDNNGLLACAQFMETNTYVSQNGVVSSQQAPCFTRVAEVWPDVPRTFEQLQQLPNAYLGPARDGCYAPYRLSRTCQTWQSGSDAVTHVSNALGKNLDGYSWTAIPDTPAAPDYPYGLVGPSKAGTELVHKRADDGVIHISIRNIAANASFTLYIRSGWEYQVLPGTTLAPFAKVSPMYDPTALTTYYRISRELKDAYPASYNDLGKLLGIIGNVAKNVIGTLFPAARIPLMAASAARGLLASRTSGQTPRGTGLGVTSPTPETLSAADKERLAQKYRAARPPKSAPGKRPQKGKGKTKRKAG